MEGYQIEERTRDGKEILIYSIAKPEDFKEVDDFAAEYFFNDSPFRELESFNSRPDSKAGLFAWRQEFLRKCLARPTTILIREKSSGHLVAYAAFLLEDKDDPTIEIGQSNDINDRSPGWLDRAIASELYRGVDLYARYGTDRIFHHGVGAVRRDYRGHGLFGNQTLAIVAKMIKVYKPGAVKGEVYSQYIYKQLEDWEVIRSIELNTFKLPDATQPFAGIDLGIHHTLRLMARRVLPTEHEDDKYVSKSKM